MFENLGIRSNWVTYSLGEIIKINNNSYIDINDIDEYKILGVISWGNGVVIKQIVKGIELKMKRYQVANKNQLMWCKVDTKNGAFGVTKHEHIGTLVSQNMCLADIDTNICLPNFLQFFFRLPTVYKRLTDKSIGTTNRQYLKPIELLKVVRLRIPPLEEQRRIVARIEELLGKVEEVRSLRQKALDETEALQLSSAKAIFEELAQAGTQPLQQVVTVQGGGTPSKQNPFFWDGSIPWISPKDMKNREIYNSIDHISQEATLKSSAKLLKPGSVLIVVRGMILAHTVPCAILRVPATINQDMKSLFPNENITPEFLCCVLWAFNHSLLELVEKSTHDTRKLETTKLLNFQIPVPPLPEQCRIVAYLDELQIKVDTIKRLREQAIQELDALLPSILDKAFKGEL